MKATRLKQVALGWVAPALAGILLGVSGYLAAGWDCRASGGSHWLQSALVFPVRLWCGILFEPLARAFGFEGAVALVFPSIVVCEVLFALGLTRTVVYCLRRTRGLCEPTSLAAKSSGQDGHRKTAPVLFSAYWRPAVLVCALVAPALFLLARDPFGQDPAYHRFADLRAWLGIPNFADVSSNLAFLGVGGAGLWLCARRRIAGLSAAWVVFFSGVALVAIGSGYYHWRPCNETLIWDRLTMTVAFMGMFAGLLGEFIGPRVGRVLLVPALTLGFSSVVYWHWSDDLRFYAWVQYAPLLAIPVLLGVCGTRYSHRLLLLAALGCYALAKVSEAQDRTVFEWSNGLFGGHALKHCLAAMGCLVVLEMLRRRRLVEQRK